MCFTFYFQIVVITTVNDSDCVSNTTFACTSGGSEVYFCLSGQKTGQTEASCLRLVNNNGRAKLLRNATAGANLLKRDIG